MAANKTSRFLKGLLLAIVSLLLCGVIYVAVTLLESPEVMPEASYRVQETDESLSPLQAGSSQDAAALRAHFGAPLPYFPGAVPAGEIRNVSHDGKNAYQVTLRYQGATITAVRPASAAPLLLQADYAVSLRSDITAVNLPGVLATNDGQYCLYFSSDLAAHCLNAPARDAAVFLQLAEEMQLLR